MEVLRIYCLLSRIQVCNGGFSKSSEFGDDGRVAVWSGIHSFVGQDLVCSSSDRKNICICLLLKLTLASVGCLSQE